MIRSALIAAVAMLPSAALAQDTVITSPIDGSQTVLVQPDVAAETIRAVPGQGARLKGLDKISGNVVDFELTNGQTAEIGRLDVLLGECRYPEDNPNGEAYAWIEVRDRLRDTDVFSGWMIASSPALSAMDHPRYDVWVIRCTTA